MIIVRVEVPRSSIGNQMVEICSVAGEAVRCGVPAEQIIEERAEKRLSRRDFIKRAGGAALLIGGAAFLPHTAFAKTVKTPKTKPVVVIIGAGLAGLTCAYRLKKAGVEAAVYEAATRIGGRCFTRRGFFAGEQITERGGELIDSDHHEIQDLAAELGLKLDDLKRAEPRGSGEIFYFEGNRYAMREAVADFQKIYPHLTDDLKAAGASTTHDSFTARGRELDGMSVSEWVDKNVPGGVRSKLGKLLTVAYTIEYASEAGNQSALNLIYLLAYSRRRELQLFGKSDERFHIRGGNDQLASLLAERLPNQIQTGMELVSVTRGADERMTAVLQDGAATRTVAADKLVLALPFSILRETVDISRAGFSDLKLTAIRELGMGMSAKLQLQFNERHWERAGCNGSVFADSGFQCTWDGTRAQPGKSGVLVNFTGGDCVKKFERQKEADAAGDFLGKIEPVLQGLSERWNGKVSLDYWPGQRWTRGSYSFWKVGQYTKFGGVEPMREGNCFFCGEHTSPEYQGYLNGAVSSGARAAGEILKDAGY